MNLRNFHSFRRMTRRSSTSIGQHCLWCCPSVEIICTSRYCPAFSLWPACTRDSGWRECSWQERAQEQAQRARAQRARERAQRARRSGLGRIHAELPHPAQALVEGLCAFHQLVSVRGCAEESSPRSRSLAPFTFSKAYLSAVRQPRSRRRAGARAQERPRARTRRESPSQSLCFASK